MVPVLALATVIHHQTKPACRGGATVPLDSPVQGVVADNHGRGPVQDLRADAAECVEDGVVGGAGEGVLAVERDAVRDDALLREATW